jgi:hypothetical protein
MKLSAALWVCLVYPGVLLDQVTPNSSTPPAVLILSYSRSFKMQRYLPRNWENLPESYPRRSSYPSPSFGDGSYAGWPSTQGPIKMLKVRSLFVYSVEVKNIGAKKIAGVVWDFIFIGTADDREVARLQFRTRANIAVNKISTLTGESLAPPRLPKVVKVEEIEKERESPYRERVEVKCVLYADGTWWPQSKVMDSKCENLVKDKKHKGK